MMLLFGWGRRKL